MLGRRLAMALVVQTGRERGIIMTNKTFCIDQTKSLEELYALKVVTERRKMLNFHENQWFCLKIMKIHQNHDFPHFCDHFECV